jgi:hypothetical protein
MRGLLIFSCRAFPPDHRARHSDEVVDTALLAADGSAWRAGREAFSLVLAGYRQRLRSESHRSLRDGAALLAGVLSIVNLAVALAGILSGFGTYAGPSVFLWSVRYGPGSYPFVVDWWWIAFTAAAAGIVLGLALGQRRLAAAAAVANLGLVAYDAFVVNGFPYDGKGHFDVFTTAWTLSFPGGREWLVAAAVLALATVAARPRRLPLVSLPLALLVVGLLVWAARDTRGAFFFLRWPLAVFVLLAVAFGAVAPRFAVLAIGVTLAAIPGVVVSFSASTINAAPPYRTTLHHDPLVIAVVAAGLAVGVLLPLAQLARRRLT